MPIQVEFMKDEPITVYHYPEKLESNQDIRDAVIEATNHNRNLTDPVIWVIHDTTHLKLVKLAAKAAGQRQYGSWQVAIFNTYEEALAHAREDLAQRKQG
jgi:hypothetical protein